jgi:hypothetical protein
MEPACNGCKSLDRQAPVRLLIRSMAETMARDGNGQVCLQVMCVVGVMYSQTNKSNHEQTKYKDAGARSGGGGLFAHTL